MYWLERCYVSGIAAKFLAAKYSNYWKEFVVLSNGRAGILTCQGILKISVLTMILQILQQVFSSQMPYN